MVSASGGTPPASRNARRKIGHAVIVATALGAGCVGQIAGPPGGSGAPTGAAGPINPGRVVAHRLNNVEYDNTIRDLTGVDMKPSSDLGFPDDAYVEGFDNNADALTAPPLLLEKLEAAAEAVVTSALDTSPANAQVRSRIMICDPQASGEAGCASTILTAFASRAFRRPVAAADAARYAALIDVARAAGDGFEQGIAAALQAILLSPRFLFRIESNAAAGQVEPLDGYEVASRLSYFLWSSMPDQHLLDRAATGQLGTTAAVAEEVRRMLQDAKASALVDNLAGEWLGTRELAVKQITLPDFTFDADMRVAMATEASAFLSEILGGGHAIRDLIGADFMMVNGRLATHYGLPNAASIGTTFVKVPLSGPQRAAGLLTQTNYLTVTSQRDRTSPTRRGKWISENLLCVIIPPPPPQIPQLDPQVATAPTSVRDRLAQHRQKGTTCNGCHQYIDPLGLALEHYDTVGRWRDTDSGAAIDATGTMPVTGLPFDGAGSLATDIQGDGRFLDCVIRKLMTYALGRSLVAGATSGGPMDDTSGLADLRARLDAGDGRLATLVSLVATSPAMTMRLGEDAQ